MGRYFNQVRNGGYSKTENQIQVNRNRVEREIVGSYRIARDVLPGLEGVNARLVHTGDVCELDSDETRWSIASVLIDGVRYELDGTDDDEPQPNAEQESAMQQTARQPKSMRQLRADVNRTNDRYQALRARLGNAAQASIEAYADYMVACDIRDLAEQEAEEMGDDWPGW